MNRGAIYYHTVALYSSPCLYNIWFLRMDISISYAHSHFGGLTEVYLYLAVYVVLIRLSSVLFGKSSGNISEGDDVAWNSCLSSRSANIFQLTTPCSAVQCICHCSNSWSHWIEMFCYLLRVNEAVRNMLLLSNCKISFQDCSMPTSDT